MDRLIFTMLEEKDEKKVLKRASFWNMIASVLNAITSAILLFFITRFCGINEAGIFSIASAIAYQCVSLGNFGARGVQASDVKSEFQFKDYFYLRVFSLTLMLGLLCFYAFGSGYTLEKAMVIFTFGLFKGVDVIEDLYHGEYHRCHRLDVAGVLLTIRYSISILIFVITIILSHNLVSACTISAVITIIIFFVENSKIIPAFYQGDYHFNATGFKSLLFILIPVVITNYIKLYITNAPKYAIDACLTDSIQAYFNVLFMPVFIISLISDIIFRPFVPILAEYWNNHDFNLFKKLVMRQVFIILGITIVIVLGGVIIGLTLLEIIYNVSLHDYMFSFIILLFGGGITTISSLLILIITIQREQKVMALVNVITFIICLLISNPLVQSFGIEGAVFLFFILNLFPTLFFSIIAIGKYYKEKKLSGR